MENYINVIEEALDHIQGACIKTWKWLEDTCVVSALLKNGYIIFLFFISVVKED